MDRGLRCATAGKRAKLAERVLGEPFLETALETAFFAGPAPEAHAEGRVAARLRRRFVKAYNRRNAEIVRFFAARGQAHRLVFLDDVLEMMDASEAWSKVCNFLEAWSTCPLHRPIPGRSLSVKQKGCPKAAVDSAADGAPVGKGAKYRAYKARVAAFLNSTRESTIAPPKPPPPQKPLPRSQRLALKRAASLGFVPAWHADCAPRDPRGVLYNRIPKSGSASVMAWMSGQLNATAMHQHGLSQTDVTWWTSHLPKHRFLTPADEKSYFAGIAHFGDFGRFVTQRHVYYVDVRNAHSKGVALVNVAREPVGRCVSRYNYEAFYKKRLPPVDLNECLDSGECTFGQWSLKQEQHFYQDYPNPEKGATKKEWRKFLKLSRNQSLALLLDECHNYMTRWFCGHSPECRDPARPRRALDLAKEHVEHSYAHVGVLEDLPNTVQLFRILLPTFFKGDPEHTPDEADFPELHSSERRVKGVGRTKPVQTRTKSGPLSPHNLELLYRINALDVELYYFILALHRKKVELCLGTNGTLTPPPTQAPL